MELVHHIQKCVAKVKAEDLNTSSSSSSCPTGTSDPTAASEIRFFAMPKDDPKQRKPDITRATNLLDCIPHLYTRLQ
ncbi:hypothetical protein [Sporisorium scitamineum]|uniref:Uncharacterized protein n=1 Tax=Sporisorium scitamineum TaxID=49012 RepID=A0A0F7RYV9_9BASI|nr:hypothetical protein [Sporisorium scitamineum]